METAKVSGFARNFATGKPIKEAKITVLEEPNKQFFTDKNGVFGPFEWPVGEEITLVFEKPGSIFSGYRRMQTATVVVPPEGINHDNHLKNISFQVSSNLLFETMSFVKKIKEDSNMGQIGATVHFPSATMDDIPQGEENVEVTLYPDVGIKPYYCDIYPYIHKTNFFTQGLNSTSKDGGVLFFNVPPGEYRLISKKGNQAFSDVKVKVTSGTFINASPPFGVTRLIDNPVKKRLSIPYTFFSNENYDKDTVSSAASHGKARASSPR